MTKNEKLTEISMEAFAQLCIIADEEKGKYKPHWGKDNGPANKKYWLILMPSIHIPYPDKDFNVGYCSGLTFPTEIHVSQICINMGSKFCFPDMQSVLQFGMRTKELWRVFLFPETSL